MKTIERQTSQATNEDLMKEALKHYEEASNAIHCWNSSIPKAIKAYFTSLKSQLKDAGQVRSAEETWDWLFDEALRALKHNDIENATHWVCRAKEEFASQFQEQPITVTDEMIEKRLDSLNLTLEQWKLCYHLIKWALSLKAQKAQLSDEDIEAWALYMSQTNFSYSYYDGLIEGAKYNRDGLIPAKDKK